MEIKLPAPSLTDHPSHEQPAGHSRGQEAGSSGLVETSGIPRQSQTSLRAPANPDNDITVTHTVDPTNQTTGTHQGTTPQGPEQFAPPTRTHRDVNPMLRFASLRRELPQDVEGCVVHMLSSMDKNVVGDTSRLATDQANVLKKHGINNRDQFVDLLEKVEWRDRGTAILHGMTSASGFNIGSAIVDFKAAQLAIEGLTKALPNATDAQVGAVAGAALGFGMSVLDAASAASTSKTFEGAYYTRPPKEQLPKNWENVNPHTPGSLATDLSLGAGLSYGGLRNGLVRAPTGIGLEATGHPQKRALVDSGLDVAGGFVIGGGGMKAFTNMRDEGAGRAGLQYFLARTDLDAMMEHLNSSTLAQVGSALQRGANHLANVVTEIPGAAKGAFASKTGWASHVILSGGFSGVFSLINAAPQAMVKAGLSPEKAGVCKEIAKFAALQALYHGWGAALGAISGMSERAPQEPGNIV